MINLNALMAFMITMSPGLALAGPGPCAVCRAAPAPLIGAGLPVALAVGGVLLAVRLIKRFSLTRSNDHRGSPAA
jgi:hypothetical protein